MKQKSELTLAKAWASSRAFWAAARSLATSSSAVDMRSAADALFFIMEAFVLETTGENASTTVLVLLLDVPHMAAVATTAAVVNLLRRFVEGIVGGIDISCLVYFVAYPSIDGDWWGRLVSILAPHLFVR